MVGFGKGMNSMKLDPASIRFYRLENIVIQKDTQRYLWSCHGIWKLMTYAIEIRRYKSVAISNLKRILWEIPQIYSDLNEIHRSFAMKSSWIPTPRRFWFKRRLLNLLSKHLKLDWRFPLNLQWCSFQKALQSSRLCAHVEENSFTRCNFIV
jgi:hypothetical protein